MYEDRQLFIRNICKFTESCKRSLDSSLEEFGWPSSSIYSASQKELRVATYTKSDDNLGSPSKDENDCFNNTSKQIDLNEVGANPLYKELVDSLSKPAKALKDEKSKTEALIELLKLERDAKRRRINYKNRVHTKNKSHIEIMREVLAEQMSTLTQQTEDEYSSSLVKEEELGKIKPSEELIEIKFPTGNPYLAWKSVLEIKNSSHNIEKEVKSYSDDRSHARYKYSDYSKSGDFDHFDHRKEFKRGRNSNYSDSKSKYSSTRLKDRSLDSKYSHIKHDEIKSKYSNSRYDDRKSDLKYHSSSHEIGGSKYNSNRYKQRYDRDFSPDCSRKKDNGTYYKEGDSKYHDFEKQDRSCSTSPSRHKSKKHKSTHKRH